MSGGLRGNGFGLVETACGLRPFATTAANQVLRRTRQQHSTFSSARTVGYGITDMAGLESMLVSGQPVIVFVRTDELPTWDYSSNHALVVVGYDPDAMYVNDPHFADAPLRVPRGDFELAWLERDYYYALVTL